MAKYNGTTLSIEIGTYLSGVAIELNTNVSLSVNTAEVECTNKDSSGWKEFLPGTKDWSMSGTCFIDYAATQGLDEAVVAWLAGTAVTATFAKSDAATGDANFHGSAYFTNIEQTGDLDGAAEWTFSLSGSGALTSVATV